MSFQHDFQDDDMDNMANDCGIVGDDAHQEMVPDQGQIGV